MTEQNDGKKSLDTLVAEGKALSAQLPDLTSLIAVSEKSYMEYEVAAGFCYGWSLLNIPHVAVQKSFMTAGATFPLHSHGEIEIIIVFVGRLKVVSAERECEIGVGQVARFEPGLAHSVTALEHTKLIGITIPRSEGYPNG